MNFPFVFRQLGLLLIVLSLTILFIGAMEFIAIVGDSHAERHAAFALLASGGMGLFAGSLMCMATRGRRDILDRREALLLVALSWILGAGLAALPFFLWARFDPALAQHPFHSFVDCYFEAMSGLTTTGASILANIEAVPRSLLLWRSATHWLGGLGIVVLFVAVLPTLGVGGKKLFQVESPGPSKQGVTPRIRETARILWVIYLAMTVLQTIALRLCGLDWFESICHTFATLGTGGFSTRNASVGAFDSVAVEVVIMIFMLLAGVNFGLYYQFFRGRIGLTWRDPELRLYLLIILVASIIVSGGLIQERILSTRGGPPAEATIAEAVRHGTFQVIAIITTTGFCTADFDKWGFFPKAILITLMFIGGCAGSTGGGIKVVRVLIAFKVIIAEVRRIFEPNVVRKVRIGHASIESEMRLSVLVFVMTILMICLAGTMLLMLFESHSEHGIDFTTAATASATTLNNVGPGLARVGAIENFGWFTPQSKLLMSLLMALGRLELFAILVLFVPGFWKKD